MTDLSRALNTELLKPSVLLFGAVQIELPGYSLRLLDGAAALTFNSAAWTGRDATYGTLGGVELNPDGLDGQAASARITLLPPPGTPTADLASPTAQGSAVAIWFGAVNSSTGVVIADPYLVFLGELDVPTLEVDRGSRSLIMDVVGAEERFFDQDEGARLSNGFHQSVWPGELGLAYVVSVQQQMNWGQDGPRPKLITDVKTSVGPVWPDYANYASGVVW